MQKTHFLAHGSFAGEPVEARNLAWSKPVRLGRPEGILGAMTDVRASYNDTSFLTYVFGVNASSAAGTSERWKSGSYNSITAEMPSLATRRNNFPPAAA